jgi:nitrite reductase (NADH) large subunit
MATQQAKQRLVLVGNGMAGVRTLEELLQLTPDLYDITVFGAEPYGNYNRILLSPVLAGEMQLDDITLNAPEWYAEQGITLHLKNPVTGIDRAAHEVIAADGTRAPYDKLLLATGSRPFILPIPGKDLPGVIGYRDIADTQTMIDTAAQKSHAVVIGAGLLGLEAANGLMLRGMTVTVVHLAEWLMERQLDKTAADLLQASLEQKGIRFRLASQTAELLAGPDDRVGSVRLADGETLPAELVVMAAGIRPDTALAEAAGLACQRGIVVNDRLQSVTDPDIYAVGECANHRGIAYGLVAPLFEQAQVCANHLAQIGTRFYAGSVTSTKLKVTGIALFSAGNFMGSEGSDTILLHDPEGGIYKKLVLKDNVLTGALMYGDTADSGWYWQLLREGKDLGTLREHLMFGQFCASQGDQAQVAPEQ